MGSQGRILFFQRISFKQAVAAFLVGILLGLVGGGVQIARNYSDWRRDIEVNISQMSEMVELIAAEAAYNLDEESARGAVAKLTDYWAICKVDVVDDFGVTIASVGKDTTALSVKFLGRFLPPMKKIYEKPLIYAAKNVRVGELKIHVNDPAIQDKFLTESSGIFINEVTKAIVLSLVLAFIFYYLLTGPLFKIAREISMMDISNPAGGDICAFSAKRNDEVGVLVRTVNGLLKRVREQNETLKSINIDLEIKVRDRTKELENAQEKLVRSEKLAYIGKLAGSIAHELRTPLGVLKNAIYFVNMRLGHISDEKVKSHLRIMEGEIEVSNRIISDILTFGRVREPQRLATDINLAIKNAISKIDVPASVVIKKDLNNDLPKVMADRIQIEQVLLNVLVNAVQSMPDGGDLRITSLIRNGFTEVEVKDSGTGIPPENLPKIFEPLFSTKIIGTGLGLTICKHIMDMHKGYIHIESRENEGTCVTLGLPS